MTARPPGVTLAETLVYCLLLSLAMTTAFLVFNMGNYYFQLGLMRQGFQSDARKALMWLERDVRESCLDGITAATNSTSNPGLNVVDGQPRFGICLPGMSDWNNAANFDAYTGAPKYDRYFLYYATQQTPTGTLFRMEIDPNGSPLSGAPPYNPSDFASDTDLSPWSPSPPTTLSGAQWVASRELSASVLGFSVGLPANGSVECVLTVSGVTHSMGGVSNSRTETIQLDMYAPVYTVVR